MATNLRSTNRQFGDAKRVATITGKASTMPFLEMWTSIDRLSAHSYFGFEVEKASNGQRNLRGDFSRLGFRV